MGGPLVELGRVVGAHGIRGDLRVRFFGDGPDHLLEAPWIALAGAALDGESQETRFEVIRAGLARPGEVALGLAGVNDREAALAFRGRIVLGDPAHLPELSEGEHYWYELVGCRVSGGDGRPVGTVRELWETGAHDVLVIEGEDGRTRLVPTARDLLREVDVAGRRIVVEDLPGLLEPAQGGH